VKAQRRKQTYHASRHPLARLNQGLMLSCIATRQHIEATPNPLQQTVLEHPLQVFARYAILAQITGPQHAGLLHNLYDSLNL
jgi:hypothetical protein